jgi:predicted membrane protein
MKETGLLGFFTAVGITCFTVGGIVLTANHTFAPHYALKELGRKVDDNFIVLEKKLEASDLKMEKKLDENFVKKLEIREEMNAIRTELAQPSKSFKCLKTIIAGWTFRTPIGTIVTQL